MIIILILAGCADRGDYPALLPTDQVLAAPVVPVHARPAAADPAPVVAAATSRADAVRARADRLRGPVIDPATRARMQAARR
ncbi:hypothetical protein [Paracoccus sp. (in: a-proteobacteria)]|uniref:hypothetical protein n=1 Tax=Paracoccus sp. TaxID=267 RepID=UPI0026DFDC1A|nr:hypothetical protein [Paracoccus sp. (in: a-proteobacteria)]MDO5648024.1 hypothetical protein [Paracoccus sp. (in: a-proteobacteria)]